MSELTRYTCEQCGQTFESPRPNAEALAEARTAYGEAIKPEDFAVICDPCNSVLLRWVRGERSAYVRAYQAIIATRQFLIENKQAEALALYQAQIPARLAELETRWKAASN